MSQPTHQSKSRRNRPTRDQGAVEILESMSDGLIALDREWRYTYVNAAAERLTGLPREKMLGRTREELFPAVSGAHFESACRRAMDERVAVHFEEYHAPSGTWFQQTAYPSTTGIIVYTQDITARKRAEEEKRRLALLVENSTDFIGMALPAGEVQFVNRAGQKLVGLDGDEQARTTQMIDYVAEQDRQRFQDQALAAVLQNGHWEGEILFRNFKTGEPIPVLQHIFFITEQDSNRRVVLATISRDVTEQKRLRQALSEQERLFHRIAELTPVVVGIFDFAAQRHTYISSDVVNLYGYTADEIAQMKGELSALVHPEDVSRLKEHLVRLKQAADGEINEFECRVRRRDGEWRWTAIRSMPFERNEQGELRQIVSATLDITGRKQSEEALQASEERFRSYFDLGLIGMAIISPTGGILAINDQACEIFGYERNELLQIAWPKLIHPDDLAADHANFNRALAGEIDAYSMDERWIRKDGQVIYSTISTKCLRRADGSVDYFVSLLQDITASKKAREELETAYAELERRVTERTAALSEMNTALQKEIEERKRVEAERGSLLRRIVLTQEDERRRIAREMHDQFGQGLSALTLKLATLKAEHEGHPELHEQLNTLEGVAKQLDADVDFLVRQLRPTALDDLGLLVALSNYVKNWSRHFNVRAELHASGMEKGRLESEIETVLYRLLQEALNNVAKHALASSVDVLLERNPNHISLIVEDDGIGFDVENAFGAGKKGLGLMGMRERVALVGGTLDIESDSGKGATLVVRIPTASSSDGWRNG